MWFEVSRSHRRILSVAAPVALTGLALIVVFFLQPRSPVGAGIVTGMVLALAQSLLSTGAMSWAWNKKFFYWVWGAGLLLRLLVLAATAFIIYRYTDFNLVATLLTLVSASTLFLVIESYGFPSTS